jgi:hypothetical protein
MLLKWIINKLDVVTCIHLSYLLMLLTKLVSCLVTSLISSVIIDMQLNRVHFHSWHGDRLGQLNCMLTFTLTGN